MSIDKLKEFCLQNSVKFKALEPMALHTSFKIGGPADIFINVDTEAELSEVLKECERLSVPYFIIGKGSNLLVSDDGIEGAVISLSGMNEISVKGDYITCGAGVALSELCRFALENSLTGLEFAFGIPGSVGGAMFMNAGAYGGEMADVVYSAEVLSPSGERLTVFKDDMALGYRKSAFKSGGMIVLSATFKMQKGEKGEINCKMQDFISRRQSKQPLEYPSAGSFFKRPEGYFAGALIEKNGLKGFTVGGAQISEKHAGFVINRGGATAEDVNKLGERVAEKVYKADGVTLEREVIFIGRK